MHRYSRYAALFALVLFGGCAAGRDVEVTRFHTLASAPEGSFVIIARDAGKAGLEFDTYAALISRHLAAQGFTQPAGGPPSLIVQVDYYQREIHGEDGSDTSLSVGVGGGSGGYHGSGVGVGVGMSFPLSKSKRVMIDQWLIVDIDRASSGTRVFEGRVRGQGRTTDFARHLPGMIDAMFKDFPGTSGETVVYEVPLP